MSEGGTGSRHYPSGLKEIPDCHPVYIILN